MALAKQPMPNWRYVLQRTKGISTVTAEEFLSSRKIKSFQRYLKNYKVYNTMSITDKAPYPFSESLKTTIKTFLIVVVFSIAFGYIEAAVVVYLRQIFYPEGFTFPITLFDDIDTLTRRILLTEIGREAATIGTSESLIS